MYKVSLLMYLEQFLNYILLMYLEQFLNYILLMYLEQFLNYIFHLLVLVGCINAY